MAPCPAAGVIAAVGTVFTALALVITALAGLLAAARSAQGGRGARDRESAADRHAELSAGADRRAAAARHRCPRGPERAGARRTLNAMGDVTRVEIDAHSIDRLGRVLARELGRQATEAAAPPAAPEDMAPLTRQFSAGELRTAYADEAGQVRWVALAEVGSAPKAWRALYVRG